MVRKTKEEAQRTRQQIIDAAREVFHQNGVARSTLEQVAKTAGLTRGAVYWHFKSKAELFHAMRADLFDPMCARSDTILFSDDYSNPLDAIEHALKDFFAVLDQSPVLKQVMEIVVLRCENVDEFAAAQAEAERPAMEFLEKVQKVYTRAAERNTLRPGLEPATLARDTWAFVSGLLHLLLARHLEGTAEIDAMIAAHVAMRRGSR